MNLLSSYKANKGNLFGKKRLFNHQSDKNKNLFQLEFMFP